MCGVVPRRPGAPAGSVHSVAHPADTHALFRIRGAREHNLRGVDLDLPKRRLTAFTGVSGSSKSSLVFHTIAAESQRLINETYSAFLQGFMPTLPLPAVDVLDGLTTAITVGQQRMGSDARSSVGTATDADALQRNLFGSLGDPHVGSPQAFSFNVASISGAGAVTFDKGGREVTERREFSVTGGMCRSSLIDGRSIADASAMQVGDLAEWVRGVELSRAGASVAPLLESLRAALESFVTVGLGYLSLDRPAARRSV